MTSVLRGIFGDYGGRLCGRVLCRLRECDESRVHLRSSIPLAAREDGGRERAARAVAEEVRKEAKQAAGGALDTAQDAGLLGHFNEEMEMVWDDAYYELTQAERQQQARLARKARWACAARCRHMAHRLSESTQAWRHNWLLGVSAGET